LSKLITIKHDNGTTDVIGVSYPSHMTLRQFSKSQFLIDDISIEFEASEIVKIEKET